VFSRESSWPPDGHLKIKFFLIWMAGRGPEIEICMANFTHNVLMGGGGAGGGILLWDHV
jgi:hypothetical protein